MKKISKLVVALVALPGIAFTAGCKSDCEKAYDNLMAKLPEEGKKKYGTDEQKKKMLDKCSNFPPEAQKCLAGLKDPTDFEAQAECTEKGK